MIIFLLIGLVCLAVPAFGFALCVAAGQMPPPPLTLAQPAQEDEVARAGA
jgi:hypothetical protein